MTNELIFFLYLSVVCVAALLALWRGIESLVSWVCVLSVLMNLFATKKIQLLGFSATASDALAVGIGLCLNLIQEYWGRPQVLRAIWTGFFCSIFYVFLSICHLAYLPAPDDVSQPYFQWILEPMPRMILASLFVFILVQHLDATLYHYLARLFRGRYYVFRNYLSLALSQLFDTVLFTVLGLYQLNENYQEVTVLAHIVCVSYAIKCMTILFTTPFLMFSKKIRLQ